MIKDSKETFDTPFLKIQNICAFKNRELSLLHTNYEFLDMTGPCQTSKKRLFTEIVNIWRLLVIFWEISILDFWHGSEYTSAWYEVEGYIGVTLVTFSKLPIAL